MSDSHGMVWWTELMTRDVPRAVKYYETVCGWNWDTMEMQDGSGDYYIGKKGDTPLIGIMDMSSLAHLKDVPPHWFSYFAVDDVDAAVQATKDAGGSQIRDVFEVPGIGRIAMLMDPTGAAMGLLTPSVSPS